MKNFNIKHAVFLILFAVLSDSLYSQDLIVTNEGDSLNCKITKIKADNIYFTFKYKEEIRSTLIPLNQVKYHQYNYYRRSIVPEYKVIAREKYPHFRTAISGGWSYMVARLADDIPSDFETYYKELKSGYHYGLDLSYYFTEQLGFGFEFYTYRTKNEMDNIYVTYQDGTTQYGKMGDDISIIFSGLLFSIRLLDADKKNSFLMNGGIGYMGYKNNALLITDYTLKGNTLGFSWHFSYDIGLSENLVLGFQFSYLTGVLRECEWSDGTRTVPVKLDEEHYEGLNRIDLSIGLRFSI